MTFKKNCIYEKNRLILFCANFALPFKNKKAKIGYRYDSKATIDSE